MQYDLFDMPEPKEHTDEDLRFAVEVPSQGEAVLREQKRCRIRRQEELRRQRFRLQSLLDEQTQEKAAEVSSLASFCLLVSFSV